MLFAATSLDTTILVIAILGAVALGFLILFILYLIIASRRFSIVMKKVDYLVEDVTYKSQMLNSSVELADKVSKYLDGFDSVFKGGIKSTLRVIFGNKDFFADTYSKIKDFFFIENEDKTNKKENKNSEKNDSKDKENK